jgi:dUTP pyrophosphatase
MEFAENSLSFCHIVDNFKNTTHHHQIMVLNMFIGDDRLKNTYLNAALNHNNSLLVDPHFFNSGFDLFLPESSLLKENVNKLSFDVKCSAKICHINSDDLNTYYTGYYMYPRSSLSKTPLRLANSTGIIDAGYRGPLIGMFDCLENNFTVNKHTRLLQICAPNLMPIYVNIVDTFEELGAETSRGEGGFGSTGL